MQCYVRVVRSLSIVLKTSHAKSVNTASDISLTRIVQAARTAVLVRMTGVSIWMERSAICIPAYTECITTCVRRGQQNRLCPA